MSELELNTDYLVSQCYDGASVMSGCNAGVQKFIKEKSPQAVYIHCCAHRLNLVLVDVCKGVRAASDFFSHLQALYVFLSASKSHELFLSNQNATGGREIRLKKLSDTRWSCRIDSIATILSTYSAVIKTLEDIAEGNNRDRAIEARGILSGVRSFTFVVALVIYKKIFSVSANLSDLLQSQSIDLSSASYLIQSTIDNFRQLRTHDQWELIWEEINVFAKHHDIEISPRTSRRQRHLPSNLDYFVVTANTIGSVGTYDSDISLGESYKTSVYFATLDLILVEMNERFSESNLSLLRAVDALFPKSKNFLSVAKLEPFLKHYHGCLPPVENIENEIQTFKNYLLRNPAISDDVNGLHDLLDHISPIKAAFPILYTCFQITLTIGTSTASVERSFSSLRCLKTYLRSTMTQQRLDGLALLYSFHQSCGTQWKN